MTQAEFIVQPGYAFAAALRNPYASYASLATGLSVTEVVPGVYRFATGSLTGVVHVECVAGALRVVGYANLSKPGDNGYSEVFDTLQEAEALNDAPITTPTDPGDTVSAESIAISAAGPQTITVDGLSITQRPMSDQIAADRHVAANNSTTPRRGFGLRFARVRPGSAVGE